MNLFGTDGIRAKFGNWPLSQENIIDLGKSIATWATYKKTNPKIIIAHDTRSSSPLIKCLLSSSLLQYNIDLYDAKVLPTPAVYNLVQKQNLFDFGIMITASHNQYEDNGIKIVDFNNQKLCKTDEEIISQIFFKKDFGTIDYDNLGKLHQDNNAQEIYIISLLNSFTDKFLSGIKIAIDCANGANSNIAQKVFAAFGAETIIIENIPNGKNINKNCGSTHPQILQKIVLEKNADIGFAFDGDGDRIVVVNKDGQIKDGDDILFFLLEHSAYKADTLVTTKIANFGLEVALNKKSKKIIRTEVGDKFVVQELIKNKLFIGGEPSGHIILRDYLNSSDGLFVALRILEHAILTNNLLITTFDKFPQFSINLNVTSRKDLSDQPFCTIISKYQNMSSGRIIVRYSGTEPLLRIVVEDVNYEKAKKIANQLYEELSFAFENEKEIKENNEKETHYSSNI